MESIMHIISGDLWAGAESQAYTFLKALNKTDKYKITAVIFNEGELYNKLIRENIDVQLIDEKKYNSVQMLWQLIMLIRTVKPEIIHSHEYKSHILAISANMMIRSRARIFRTLHGLTKAPFKIRYIKSHLVLLIDDIVLRYFTDCIIAVSGFIEKVLNDKYPHIQVCQINNAVDIDIAEQSTDLSQTLRSSFGISPDMFWIATAARLVPVKNLEMLIESARLLVHEKKIKFVISIFGDGPAKNNLLEKITSYGLNEVIRLHGHKSDIHTIMKAWDVFVLTSKNEGLPMSLLEAMSIGIIPICTRVGGMQEVIDDQKDGFLVELNNYKELADKLCLLYHEDEERKRYFKDNAKQKVTQEYSIANSLEKLIAEYKKSIEAL